MLKSNIKNCAPLGSGWDLNPPSFSKVRTTSATGGYGSAWRTIPTRWRSVGHPPTGTTLPVCPQRAGACAAFRLGSWGCSKRRSEAGKVTGSLVILHGHKMMVFTWLRWHIEIPKREQQQFHNPSSCFSREPVRASSGRITARSSLRPLAVGKHTEPCDIFMERSSAPWFWGWVIWVGQASCLNPNITGNPPTKTWNEQLVLWRCFGWKRWIGCRSGERRNWIKREPRHLAGSKVQPVTCWVACWVKPDAKITPLQFP